MVVPGIRTATCRGLVRASGAIPDKSLTAGETIASRCRHRLQGPSSIWRPSTATSRSRTSSRPSACSCARRRIPRLSNTRCRGRCRPPWFPSTKLDCRTRSCSRPSSTSSTNWPRSKQCHQRLKKYRRPSHERAARNDDPRTLKAFRSKAQGCPTFCRATLGIGPARAANPEGVAQSHGAVGTNEFARDVFIWALAIMATIPKSVFRAWSMVDLRAGPIGARLANPYRVLFVLPSVTQGSPTQSGNPGLCWATPSELFLSEVCGRRVGPSR